MIGEKRVIVVMPAYNAEATLRKTIAEVDRAVVDELILVDDGSRDQTRELARELGLRTFVHDRNYGYGRNQKTCYREALALKPDIVIMLHPDYQYTPRLLGPMAAMIACDEYDVVLGSRILCGTALKGGMPVYKYIANRLLTFAQNILMGTKISEFHTGYRGFSAKVLREIPVENNSDDFVFDNEILAQIVARGFRIGEISCPTKYMAEASSINFRRSVVYGLGVLWTALRYFLHQRKWMQFALFKTEKTKTLDPSYYQEVPTTHKA